MADIFTGTVAPNVTTTKETAAVAPQYLTDYLTSLAKAGTSSLNNGVAPLSQLQTGAMAAAPTDLNAYKPAMTSALDAAQAGSGVSQADISRFYNPYEQAVVNQMADQSAINTQRNLQWQR